MHGPLDPAGNDPVEGPLHGLLAPGPWVGFARSTYLVTLDLAALILCATIAYFSWALPVHGQAAELYVRLVPLLGLFVLGYALFGLYPGLGLGGVELLRRLTVVTLFCFFFLAAASFALKLPHVYSRMTYAIAVSASVVVLPFFRYAGLNRARRWQWWPKPVVLIAGPEERSRVSAVASSGGYDYRVVGILHPKGAEWPEESTAGPVLGSLDVAPQVTERGISIAVVVAERAPGRELLDELRRHFRHVMIVRSYSEAAVERLQVRNLGRHLGIEYANNLLVPGNRFLKRALDLLGASIGLMITAPVMGLAMLLARISSPGPALFYQIRRGFRGRRFRMPKIRTMYEDAEQRLKIHLESDVALKRAWQDRFKLEDDPRVVPYVGSFLRRLSLDELPQLVSVLRGQMSLVGPRPLPDYHLESLSRRVRELRMEVRPGVTGLWQVSGRASTCVAEQEARDEYYIRNWTIWLDLYVLGKTVGAVISGRGAY